MRRARSRYVLIVLAVAMTAGGAWWLIRRHRSRPAIEPFRGEEYAFAPVPTAGQPEPTRGHVEIEEAPLEPVVPIHAPAEPEPEPQVEVEVEVEVAGPRPRHVLASRMAAGAASGAIDVESGTSSTGTGAAIGAGQPAGVAAATPPHTATATAAPTASQPVTAARFERPPQATGATAVATAPPEAASPPQSTAEIPTIVRSSAAGAAAAAAGAAASGIDSTLLQLASRSDDPLGIDDEEFDRARRRRTRRRVMMLVVLTVVLAAAVFVVTVDRTRKANERRDAAASAKDDAGKEIPDPDEAGGVGGTFTPEGKQVAEPNGAAATNARGDAAVDTPAKEPVPVNIAPRTVAIRRSGATGTILVPASSRSLTARSLVLRRVPRGAPLVARMQPVKPRAAAHGTPAFARTFLFSPKLTGTWLVTVTAANGEVTQAQVALPCRARAGCELVLVSPVVKP